MRRSILDIAFVKKNHYAVSDFHCPISRPYRAITVGGELPRLKPGLSSQGPSSFVILTTADRSGRYADTLSTLPFSIAFSSSRSDDRQMSQSIRNKIPGTISEITSEQVLSEVIIDTAIGPVAAVITTRSLREMQLKVGDPVSALIKATNVSIEKGDSK